ncbi:MAG: hypothetical protein ABIH11_06845 [Candidatus Altiarchaeota archaeon]
MGRTIRRASAAERMIDSEISDPQLIDRRRFIRERDERRVQQSEREGMKAELKGAPQEVQLRLDSIGVVGFERAFNLVRSSRVGRHAQLESLTRIYEEGGSDVRDRIEAELNTVGADIGKWKRGEPMRKNPELLLQKERILKGLRDAGARPLVVPEFIGACAMRYGTEPYEYERRADGPVVTDSRGNPVIIYETDSSGQVIKEAYGRDKPRRTDLLNAFNAAVTLPQEVISGSVKSWADVITQNCLTDVHRLLLERPQGGPWTTAEIAEELDYFHRFDKDPGSGKDRQYVLGLVGRACGVLEWMGLVDRYPQDSMMGAEVSNRYIHAAHYYTYGGLPNDNVDFWILRKLHEDGPQSTSSLFHTTRKAGRVYGRQWAPFNEGAVNLGLVRMATDGLIRVEGVGSQTARLTPAGIRAMKAQEDAEQQAAEAGVSPYLDRGLCRLILGTHREGLNARQLRRYNQMIKAVTIGRMLDDGIEKPAVLREMNPELRAPGLSRTRRYESEWAYICQVENGTYPWSSIDPRETERVYLPALNRAEADGLIPEGHTQWFIQHAIQGNTIQDAAAKH